jgi:DNA-binding NarL/FixJ family response regulator
MRCAASTKGSASSTRRSSRGSSLASAPRGPLDALTERERQVLALVAEGHSNGAIADKRFLSRKTVDAHISQIFLKLDLRESPEHHRRVLAVLAFLRSA